MFRRPGPDPLIEPLVHAAAELLLMPHGAQMPFGGGRDFHVQRLEASLPAREGVIPVAVLDADGLFADSSITQVSGCPHRPGACAGGVTFLLGPCSAGRVGHLMRLS